MIIVKKLNNCFLQIISDAGDQMTVSEYFTKYTQGYLFAPSYKSGRWDGTIKIFNRGTGTLPYGLFNELFKCCELNRIDYELEKGLQEELELDDFDEEIFNEVIKHFDATKKKEIDARDYQIEGAKIALRSRRGQLHHAPGAGKTFTLYLIMSYLLRKNPNEKIMVVVPTIGLVKQFHTNYVEFGMDVDKLMGQYYSKEKDLTKPITVGTWQSLKNSGTFLEQVTMVISDENHGSKATEVKNLMELCVNANIRIGVSGSQHENECDRLTVEGNFGPVLSVVTAKELIDSGFSSNIQVFQLNINYKEEVKKMLKEVKKLEGGKKAYEAEKEYIQNSERRREIVRKIVENRGPKENILLLFDELEFGESIRDYLIEKFPNRTVYYVAGNVKPEVREQIRQDTNNQEGVLIVASSGTFSLGIDIPKLHSIILLWIGKSAIKIQQSIGRGLRLHYSKNKLRVYDLADQLHYSKEHSSKRIQFYFKENFPVSFYEIDKN